MARIDTVCRSRLLGYGKSSFVERSHACSELGVEHSQHRGSSLDHLLTWVVSAWQAGHARDLAWLRETSASDPHFVEPHPSGTERLILDREPLDTKGFREILKSGGVNVVRLPARSPNLGAIAGRFMRSGKSECLSRISPLGEPHLRVIPTEYLSHYHRERNHRGLGNELIEQLPANTEARQGLVRRRVQLGGVHRDYCRDAS